MNETDLIFGITVGHLLFLLAAALGFIWLTLSWWRNKYPRHYRIIYVEDPKWEPFYMVERKSLFFGWEALTETFKSPEAAEAFARHRAKKRVETVLNEFDA